MPTITTKGKLSERDKKSKNVPNNNLSVAFVMDLKSD